MMKKSDKEALKYDPSYLRIKALNEGVKDIALDYTGAEFEGGKGVLSAYILLTNKLYEEWVVGAEHQHRYGGKGARDPRMRVVRNLKRITGHCNKKVLHDNAGVEVRRDSNNECYQFREIYNLIYTPCDPEPYKTKMLTHKGEVVVDKETGEIKQSFAYKDFPLKRIEDRRLWRYGEWRTVSNYFIDNLCDVINNLLVHPSGVPYKAAPNAIQVISSAITPAMHVSPPLEDLIEHMNKGYDRKRIDKLLHTWLPDNARMNMPDAMSYRYYAYIGALIYKCIIIKMLCPSIVIPFVFFSVSKNQGVGKGVLSANLVPSEWQSVGDSLDLTTSNKQEFMESMSGNLVNEHSDINVFSKSAIATFKRNVTLASVQYRKPYERISEKHRINGILMGTINDLGDGTIPIDPSGYRRYMVMLWKPLDEEMFPRHSDMIKEIRKHGDKLTDFLCANNRDMLTAALLWFMDKTGLTIDDLRVRTPENIEAIFANCYKSIRPELGLTDELEDYKHQLVSSNKYHGDIGYKIAEIVMELKEFYENSLNKEDLDEIYVLTAYLRYKFHGRTSGKLWANEINALEDAGFVTKIDNAPIRLASADYVDDALMFMSDINPDGYQLEGQAIIDYWNNRANRLTAFKIKAKKLLNYPIFEAKSQKKRQKGEKNEEKNDQNEPDFDEYGADAVPF